MKLNKTSFLPDKFEKHAKPFTATLEEMYLETMNSGATYIIMKFAGVADLRVNLKYENWVEKDGEKTPKAGTPIYKFLKSLADLDIEVEINDTLTDITTTPEIIGKEVSFDCKSKSFIADEIDPETEKPKEITFFIWTVTKVAGKEFFTPAKVEKAPEAPKASVPVDLAKVKQNWITIISELPEKFSFSQMIQAKGKFMSGKVFSDSEKVYYTSIDKVKEMLNTLTEEGYIARTGAEYKVNTDKILEAQMAEAFSEKV